MTSCSLQALSAVAVALSAAVSCSGQTVIVGELTPTPVFRNFVNGTPVEVQQEAGRAVANVNGLDDDENPTLTADMREIFFTSRRAGGPGAGDIWTSTRAQRDLPFGPPNLVDAASTEALETSSAISLDGLTLWFGSDREGAMGGDGDIDIWRITRTSRQAPWGLPENVGALNSTENDIPRPPGAGGRIMPLASQRDSPGVYQTYLAELPFAERLAASPQLVTGLLGQGRSVVDAFLTSEGLGLLYNWESKEDAELYFAWRWTLEEPFSQAIALDPLNSEGQDRDPWLSPDESLIVFTTNRRGSEEIFAAQVQLPPRD